MGQNDEKRRKKKENQKVPLVIMEKGWYTATDNLIMGDAIFVVTPSVRIDGGRRSI